MVMILGEKVKEFRKQRELSQQDLSLKSKVPQTTISDIELGKATPSIDKVMKIAKALNIPLEELLKTE